MKKILFYLISFLFFNLLFISCEIENKLDIFSNNDSTFSSPILELKNDTLIWGKKVYALNYYIYINNVLTQINEISDTFYRIDKNKLSEGDYFFQIAILSYNNTLNSNILGYKSNIIKKNIYNKNIKNLKGSIHRDTVSLTWEAHPATVNYRIYRDSSLIASSSNNYYKDYPLSSQKYLYYIGFIYENEEFFSDTNFLAFVDFGFQINNFVASKSAYNVSLSWQTIETPKYYQIYRNNSLLVSNYQKTTYVDSNLSKGTYKYSISAVFNEITSESSVKTIEIGTNKLSNFSAVIENKNKVNLSWDAEENAQEYIIYRNDIKIARLDSLTQTYSDNNLASGNYEYQVSFIYKQTNIESEKTDKIKLSVLSKKVQLSLANIDFGNVEIGRSKIESFYIKNIGTDTIYVDSIVYSNNSIFKGETYQGTILASKQKEINIEFLPKDTASTYSATTTIYSDADTLSLNLTGVCNGKDSVSNFKAEISNIKNVNLTWNADDRAKKYIIYKNDIAIAILDSLSASYTDSNLLEDTYVYQISMIYSKISLESGKTSKREITIIYNKLKITYLLSFGEVEKDSTKVLTFSMKNIGANLITIDSIIYPNCFSGSKEEGSTILVNESKNVNLSFKPVQITSYNGKVFIYSTSENLIDTMYVEGTCKTSDSFVKIEGGEFYMGAELEIDSIVYSYQGETPKHLVELSSFYMCKYETSNKEVVEVFNWALSKSYIKQNDKNIVHTISNAFLIDTNSSEVKFSSSTNTFYTDKDNYPVRNISWYGIISYCNFKSEKEGKDPCYDLSLSDWTNGITCNLTKNGYRLPSEAEWEYASSGGKYNMLLDPLLVYSGSSNISNVAYYYDNSSNTTHPIGEKTSNVLGLYDMSGNVWEFCYDFLDTLNSNKSSSYYTSCYNLGKVVNPIGVDIAIAYDITYSYSSKSKARRGGGFSSFAIHCRSTNRGGMSRGYSDEETGFRIVYRDN